MRALALALALLVAVPGCAAVQEPSATVGKAAVSARDLLAKALYYAQDAVAVRGAVCAIDGGGKACQELTSALDTFFALAVKVEDAINAGEDMTAEIGALEDLISAILYRAQSVARGMA